MAAGAAVGAWVLVLSLWGTVVGGQNVTARIGKPLVLNCKGAPKKPPQQLEWKLNTGRTEAWKVLSPQGGPWDSVARVLPNGSLLLPAIGIQDELGILGGLGTATLLIGIIMWQRWRRRGEERKAPENREEEEEERAELNQSEEPEAAESSAGGL
ncbi:advanced glycosylation end-product specific receptor [Rhinolophus ferrumequinum]|uniref:Advanced glycosylation end-product specific receptor n=1 Tax=Rhinolophus ferrumequinum TaxID=59479 RepID=A0A7J7YR76_RHIFE|nr:advanced glycosylation end-product specific receptor [Rhinolophus ferrumequinum]